MLVNEKWINEKSDELDGSSDFLFFEYFVLVSVISFFTHMVFTHKCGASHTLFNISSARGFFLPSDEFEYFLF